ncbi:MAG: hypothetical protein HF314_04235 [Ignavibacteria bacterium]|jgi:hypothetical protein|nr:hypothetical protein [Ignavibacteria bacterium]MCU7502259.1 hypothetical protein [Ignavibacteria bacterium]MCU7516697.1 hypothetical protein [Ignavibacteria bacterium]
MADIKIQPKKPSSISYILYALAAVAIIFLIIRSLTAPSNPVQTSTVTVDTSKVAGSVNEFAGFLNDTSRTRMDNEQSPQYTSYGLHLLSAALGATATRDAANDNNIIQQSTRLQQLSDSIQNNWSPVEKSGRIKNAFMTAANLMNSIQAKKYPKLKGQAEIVMKSAGAIDPRQEVRNQGPKVKQFFQQSAALLQGMVKKSRPEEAGR